MPRLSTYQQITPADAAGAVIYIESSDGKDHKGIPSDIPLGPLSFSGGGSVDALLQQSIANAASANITVPSRGIIIASTNGGQNGEWAMLFHNKLTITLMLQGSRSELSSTPQATHIGFEKSADTTIVFHNNTGGTRDISVFSIMVQAAG